MKILVSKALFYINIAGHFTQIHPAPNKAKLVLWEPDNSLSGSEIKY